MQRENGPVPFLLAGEMRDRRHVSDLGIPSATVLEPQSRVAQTLASQRVCGFPRATTRGSGL